MAIRIESPLGINKGPSAASAAVGKDMGFAQLLKGLVDEAVQQQITADDLSVQLALGNIDDVATVMIAAEKAALSWQLLQQVRNKMLEAFQEIMRMQV